MIRPRNFQQRYRSHLLFAAALCFLAVSCFAADVLPNIATNENRTPAGHLESGVLTLNLEIRKGVWHPEADDAAAATANTSAPTAIETYALAEQGRDLQVPGPLVRVPENTELHVTIHNLLPMETFVHGLEQHPGDGKKLLKLAPGETQETRFSAGAPGSYTYWVTTSAEERDDTDGPMAGAFIVDGPNARTDDRVFVIQLWGKNLFSNSFQALLTINGKSWPYTERLQARLGQPEHWRIVNASNIPHPMHLHGFYFSVDAVGDGESAHRYTDAERRLVVTELVPPKHTFDMTWMPERTGNWLFHCHILDHMSSYFSPFLYGPEAPGSTPAHAHH